MRIYPLKSLRTVNCSHSPIARINVSLFRLNFLCLLSQSAYRHKNPLVRLGKTSWHGLKLPSCFGRKNTGRNVPKSAVLSPRNWAEMVHIPVQRIAGIGCRVISHQTRPLGSLLVCNNAIATPNLPLHRPSKWPVSGRLAWLHVFCCLEGSLTLFSRSCLVGKLFSHHIPT